MARVTSSLFVAALMRRVMANGGFAAVLRKGSEEAGAIHIILRGRDDRMAFFTPAPQNELGETQSDRVFERSEQITDDSKLAQFMTSESRFDPDFWLVELDTGSTEPDDLFAITKP